MPNRSSYRFLNDFKIQSKINENYNRIERDFSELLVSKVLIQKLNDKLSRKIGTPLKQEDLDTPRAYLDQFVDKQHDYYKVIDEKKNKTLNHIVKNEALYMKDKYKRSIKYNPYVDVYKDEYLDFSQKELLAQMRLSMANTPKSILKPSRASSNKSTSSSKSYVDRLTIRKPELPSIEKTFIIKEKKSNSKPRTDARDLEQKAILPKLESPKRAYQNVINETNFIDKVNLFQSELIRLKMESIMSNLDTQEYVNLSNLSNEEAYVESAKVNKKKNIIKNQEKLLKKQ